MAKKFRAGLALVFLLGIAFFAMFYANRAKQAEADFTRKIVGTWEEHTYPSPDFKPTDLTIRADQTYSFGRLTGKWHRSGSEFVLERFRADQDVSFHLLESNLIRP
jgi:hypothetical protein